MSITKDKTFDRQTRLWGKTAQNSLETSSVCLVNATACGTETLKSLILPGLEHFTIVDPHPVTQSDLGKNFFVTADSLGKPRAEVIASLLQQHGVFLKKENAKAVVRDPVELLQHEPDFYKAFTLIILSGCSVKVVDLFNEFCNANNTHLVVVRNYSQLGFIQIYSKERVIFNSRSTMILPDYQFRHPWKELEDFSKQLEPESLSVMDQGRIPWLVILINGIRKWEQKTGHRTVSDDEKPEFNKMLNEWQMAAFNQAFDKEYPQDANGNRPEEAKSVAYPPFESYTEAMKHATDASSSLPPQLQALFDTVKSRDEAFLAQPADSTESAWPPATLPQQCFWVLIRGLMHYAEKHGCCPLSPSLPDMEGAFSGYYTTLQRIYRAKAAADAHELFELIQSSLQAINAVRPLVDWQTLGLTEEAVIEFSATLRHADCLHYHTLPNFAPDGVASHEAAESIASMIETPAEVTFKEYYGSDMEMHNMAFLPLLHAADTFFERHHRCPGAAPPAPEVLPASLALDRPARPSRLSKDQLDADVAIMKGILGEMETAHPELKQCKLSEATDLIREFVRFGGGEIHTVAAVAGGIAAQESFKLLTNQYITLNNTMVFMGLNCTSVTMEL